MEEMQQHQGEWFFLHELNVDKAVSYTHLTLPTNSLV